MAAWLGLSGFTPPADVASFLTSSYVIVAVGVAVALLLVLQSRSARTFTSSRTGLLAADGLAEGSSQMEDYADPLRWAFLPSGKAHRANVQHTESYESDLCSLKVLTMHRPTHEPWREKSGQYPFAWHLEGRKRLWEIRLQLRFKQVPQTKLYFGLTLGGYVPVSGVSRQVQKTLVRACRSIVGDLYHSPGDDPAKTSGEVEPPTFVMPMWAFDQFIVSSPGDEPHLWGSLDGLGMRRTDGISAYVKAMRSTVETFSTDKVYTFSFWGVSQFLDCMNWQICGGFLPGVRLDFNKLCGAPPVYVGMYEMPSVTEQDVERRHLASRKKHYFHVALWSQLRPPKAGVLEGLLGKQARAEDSKDAPRKRFGSRLAMLGCCTARSAGLADEKPKDHAEAYGALPEAALGS